MNFLTLLLPTGGTPSTGPGSKTGTEQGVAGFEQLLAGLLGQLPAAAGGQVQSATTGQLGAVAGAAAADATQALLNGVQTAAATAAETAAAPVGLVEAAAKAATAGLAAAKTTTGEAGKTPANATGAVSEALLKNGLPGALPQQQTSVEAAKAAAKAAAAGAAPASTTTTAQAAANAAQTVEQTTQQVVVTVEGATKTATTTVQEAAKTATNAAASAQKAAEQAVQKTVGAAADAVAKAAGTPAANASAIAADAASKAAGTPAAAASPAATGAQASAAAATGVAATTVKPASATADGSGDKASKPEAGQASLINSTPEVATAKTTIKSAVLQAPAGDAGKQGATSGKEKDANSNAARLRADRTAAPLAGETVAQRAEAAITKAAQHPATTQAAAASSKPADSLVQQAPSTHATTTDASAILGSGSPGTQLHADATATAHAAAARHTAPAFTPPAQQVALQFSRALATGSDHITIHLEPKSLGKVDVQVELTKDGHLTALFVADRQDTLDMLQRDARILQRALNDAGLQADTGGLSFNLRGNGGDMPQFAGQSGGSPTFNLDTPSGGDAEIAPAARYAALNADALLDIRV